MPSTDPEPARIPVTLTGPQWNLLLRALEHRYDAAPNDPEYDEGVRVGVAITHALEAAHGEQTVTRRAREMREAVERRMSVLNNRYSQFSDTDRQAVESVLADVIREADATNQPIDDHEPVKLDALATQDMMHAVVVARVMASERVTKAREPFDQCLAKWGDSQSVLAVANRHRTRQRLYEAIGRELTGNHFDRQEP